MLSFLQKKTQYKLKRLVRSENYWEKYVEYTNLNDLDILFFSLVKKGYGSLKEVKDLDTEEIFKIVEYESIISDIETLALEDAKKEL